MRRPGGKDARLWALVTATVRPLPGRSPEHAPASHPQLPPPPPEPAKAAVRTQATAAAPSRSAPRHTVAPAPIEPNRRRLIDRGREPLAATIDLHGLDQHRARDALTAFVLRAAANDERTVLVITGKGALGDGVLRRRAPEWLAEPPLRALVAGISEAHRKRGGAGALYVALRRQARTG